MAAVKAGRSCRSVAREFELSAVTVMRWAREATPDDPVTVAAALECLAEGWAPLEVAHAAGISSETVRRWVREAAREPTGVHICVSG